VHSCADFVLEVLFNRLAGIDVLYSLSQTNHGDTVFALLQIVTVTNVCCGSRTRSPKDYIQPVCQNSVQPIVFSFERYCVLSWKCVLIHERHDPFWERLMSEACVVLSWTLVLCKLSSLLAGLSSIQGDRKVSVHLIITVQKLSISPHTIDELKMAIIGMWTALY
jgi:hypothetical protein